ncbi:MAG: electron transfer flavoprotein subunit beta, partial [Acidobacteriaceae bacterium]|nr:electron transfer flavoprotein subunit beta [Acidobacteriaceae bacterium]
LPVVLTVQSGIKKLRYATLMGIKKAKTKELKSIPAADLGAGVAPKLDVDRIYLPQRSKQTQVFTGDPRQIAQQLAEKLKFEARVI